VRTPQDKALRKLNELKLKGMHNALRQQLETPSLTDMGFEDRLSILIDAEDLHRLNARKIQACRFAEACIGTDDKACRLWLPNYDQSRCSAMSVYLFTSILSGKYGFGVNGNSTGAQPTTLMYR
jgi:hypothetical protein